MTMIGLALGALSLSTAARAEDEARARKLMEDAFNRRYRWSDDFKGFSADFTYTREGKTVKGSLKADVTKPHGGVEVTCDDEAVKKQVQETVASTVTHTKAASFDKGFGSCSLAIAGDGSARGHEDRGLRPRLLQGLHRQGRPDHREPRRPRRHVQRGEGPLGRLDGRQRQDLARANTPSRSRPATTSRRARRPRPGASSTASGCRPGTA